MRCPDRLMQSVSETKSESVLIRYEVEQDSLIYPMDWRLGCKMTRQNIKSCFSENCEILVVRNVVLVFGRLPLNFTPFQSMGQDNDAEYLLKFNIRWGLVILECLLAANREFLVSRELLGLFPAIMRPLPAVQVKDETAFFVDWGRMGDPNNKLIEEDDDVEILYHDRL